jgi:hypothetical protein
MRERIFAPSSNPLPNPRLRDGPAYSQLTRIYELVSGPSRNHYSLSLLSNPSAAVSGRSVVFTVIN